MQTFSTKICVSTITAELAFINILNFKRKPFQYGVNVIWLCIRMDNDIYMCVDACSVEWVCCVVMEMCVCVETSYCSESLWSITVCLVLGLCYLTGMHLLLHCKDLVSGCDLAVHLSAERFAAVAKNSRNNAKWNVKIHSIVAFSMT